MFKGTERFGTQDYAAEEAAARRDRTSSSRSTAARPTRRRKAIYAPDRFRIAGGVEAGDPQRRYDKLMAAIGSDGSNAWTSTTRRSTRRTSLESGGGGPEIESDRFAHNVIRGFHTEAGDRLRGSTTCRSRATTRKSFSTRSPLCSAEPPYGQHSVLGFQEHLKNPRSVSKNYYKTYCVPNNMAVCLSGDFDPDEMIS